MTEDKDRLDNASLESFDVTGHFARLHEREMETRRKDFHLFDPEKDTEDIRLIREHTRQARAGNEGQFYKTFHDEVWGHCGIVHGEYQKRIQTYLDWHEESGEQAADIAENIKKYTTELLERGEKEINIVDFGAGRAETLCKAAWKMKDFVKQGKVQLIATNAYTVPNPDEMVKLRREIMKEDRRELNNLVLTIDNGLINFVQADILELYELMKDKPIHLMFMVSILEEQNAGKIADLLYKTAARLLHPKYGTLVTGPVLHTDFKTSRGTNAELLEKGFDELELAGFKKTYNRKFFVVVQGPEAPEFPLVQK